MIVEYGFLGESIGEEYASDTQAEKKAEQMALAREHNVNVTVNLAGGASSAHAPVSALAPAHGSSSAHAPVSALAPAHGRSSAPAPVSGGSSSSSSHQPFTVIWQHERSVGRLS